MRASVRVDHTLQGARGHRSRGTTPQGRGGRALWHVVLWGRKQYARYFLYVRVDTAMVVVHEAGIEAKREGVDVVGSSAPHADKEPLGVVEERVELHAHVHRVDL